MGPLAAGLGLVLAALATPAAALEISDFTSHIRIAADATVTVRETIVIDKRSMVLPPLPRNLATSFENRRGDAIAAEIEVIEALIDGRPAAFTVEGLGTGTRVVIGRERTVSSRRNHTFSLSYKLYGALGFGDEVDGLTWRATDRAWPFVVRRARVVVELPPGAPRKDMAAFVGGRKATAREVSIGGQSRTVGFTSMRPLRPGEDLTVAVTWPTGFVERPGFFDKLGRFLARNQPVFGVRAERFKVDGVNLAMGALALVLLLAYYLFAWGRAGRDPRAGTIVPLFEPPDDFSPAAVRFLHLRAFDHKVFAAAVVNMAVKGFVAIARQPGGDYALRKLNRGGDQLSPDERVVARKLFAASDELTLDADNHEPLNEALFALQDSLEASVGKRYFLHNYRYLAPGLVLSAIVVAAGVAFAFDPEEATYATLSGLAMMALSWAFAGGAIEHWREGRRRIGAQAGFAFLITLALTLVSLVWLANTASPLAPLLLTCAAVMSAVFFRLIKAPTPGGREIMDRIEGFRFYLEVAEKERLEGLNPPDRTPELFERFLPYALALDVERAWGAHFAESLVSPLMASLTRLEGGGASKPRAGDEAGAIGKILDDCALDLAGAPKAGGAP